MSERSSPDRSRRVRAVGDGLLDWLGVRGSIEWAGVGEDPAPVAGLRDGFRHHIESVARPRDAARADRLSAALDRARADARSGEKIDLERLALWQRIVLGKDDVVFRRLPAFAKRGREQYGA